MTDLSRFRRAAVPPTAPRRRSTDLTTSLTGRILGRSAVRGTADTGALPGRTSRTVYLLFMAVLVLIVLGAAAVLITGSLLDRLGS